MDFEISNNKIFYINNTPIKSNFYEELKNLKKIIFDKKFNLPINWNLIPDNIEKITFLSNYSHNIKLPTNLKKLNIQTLNKIDFELPKNLKKLYMTFTPSIDENILKNINLNKLHIIFSKFEEMPNIFLPQSIKVLIIKNHYIGVFNQSSYNPIFPINFNILPQKLKVLKIINSNSPLNILPNTLQYLSINCCYFDQDISILKNTNIKKFVLFSNHFNKPLDNLPNSLKSLKLMLTIFNYPIDNLPMNLKTLKIFDFMSFTHNLDNLPLIKILSLNCENLIKNNSLDFLPITLKSLEINSSTNINLTNLPKNLKIFKLTSFSDVVFDLKNLPNSIEVLFLHFRNFQNYNNLILPINLQLLALECRENYYNIFFCNQHTSSNFNIILHDKVQLVFMNEYYNIDEYRSNYPNVKIITNSGYYKILGKYF